MNKPRLARFLIALVALCLLSACGNKGDLVRPDHAPDNTPAPASS